MATTRIAGSFRDPSGFLFRVDGKLLRQVNHSYAKEYDALIDSGLYDTLVKKRLIVPHQEVDLSLGQTADAYKVIQPQELPFISYPYEWSFSQLKAAARMTLRLQKLALRQGMTLKDASAYNIQFHQGRPILIDSLSFERYEEGTPWVAYRQFCQHFLAPLALMALVDIRLGQLLRTNIDGFRWIWPASYCPGNPGSSRVCGCTSTCTPGHSSAMPGRRLVVGQPGCV